MGCFNIPFSGVVKSINLGLFKPIKMHDDDSICSRKELLISTRITGHHFVQNRNPSEWGSPTHQATRPSFQGLQNGIDGTLWKGVHRNIGKPGGGWVGCPTPHKHCARERVVVVNGVMSRVGILLTRFFENDPPKSKWNALSPSLGNVSGRQLTLKMR